MTLSSGSIEDDPNSSVLNGTPSADRASTGEQWPANVLPHHRKELLASGISAACVKDAGIYSSSDPIHIARLLGWNEQAKPIRDMGSCIVFPFMDSAGRQTGYARIKPDHPRERKGKVVKYESPLKQPNRAYFCPGIGATIEDSALPLFYTEGEKKALSATLHGFACVGLVGVYGFAKKREDRSEPFEFIPGLECIPLEGRPAYVAFDSDIPDKIEAAYGEWHLCETLRRKGARVRVIRLPNGPPGADGKPTKMGLDDFLVVHGTAAFQKLIDTAADPQPPRDPRPKILWHADEHRPTYEVVRALSSDRSIYQRGGSLVTVETNARAPDSVNETVAPRIEEMTLSKIRLRVTESCRIMSRKENEGKIVEFQIHPPPDLIKNVAALRSWDGIRPLEGVVRAPVLFADGRVLQTPGYDKRSGLLYLPGNDYPPVPTSVSREQAIQSANLLLDVVKDFPFAKPMHRSAWLAGVLSMVGRFAFRGNCPLFLCDANVRASGKGLLIDVACVIALGCMPAKFANVTDDDEMRKLLLGIVKAAERVAVLDNIVGTFGTAALDAALTTPIFKGRHLCTHQNLEFPMTTVFWGSGNNVVTANDTSRRVSHIRLESRLENPEDRDDMTVKELVKHVEGRREELLAAAITLLVGYIQAGRPKHGLKPWGSFEGWSALIREALVWCDLTDPGLARLGREPGGDKDADALRGLIECWKELDPTEGGITVAEMVKRLKDRPEAYPIARGVLTDLFGSDEKTWNKVSYKLRSFAGRTAGGKFFEGSDSQGGAKRWKLCSSSAGSTPMRGDDDDDGDDVLAPPAGVRAHAQASTIPSQTSSPSSPSSPAPPKPPAVVESPAATGMGGFGADVKTPFDPPTTREPGEEG
jgi:hypothetical protein